MRVFTKVLIGLGGLALVGMSVLGGVAFAYRGTLEAMGQAASLYMESIETAEAYASAETLEDTLIEAPERFALVSFAVGPDGQPMATEPAIDHRGGVSLPLASTGKITVLAGYADAVASGALDPEAPVSLSAWEEFWIPGTDGGAHEQAVEALGLTPGDPSDPTVTLDQVVGAMVRWSDNAATDFVQDAVGLERIAAVMTAHGLIDSDPGLSPMGMMMGWERHDAPLDRAHLEAVASRTPAQRVAEQARWTAAWVEDSPWSQAERAWRADHAMPAPQDQVAAASLAANRGTAREYATLMAGVVTGTFPSPEAAPHMAKHLEWPMEHGDGELVRFGAKGGALVGLITEAWFIQREGESPRVVVLILHDLPFAAWLHGVTSFTHQRWMRRVVAEPERLTGLADALEGS